MPLAKRGKITRFLNGTEDADKLAGLAEDIRDALMDYQVCAQGRRLTFTDVGVRHPCNKISTTKAVG